MKDYLIIDKKTFYNKLISKSVEHHTVFIQLLLLATPKEYYLNSNEKGDLIKIGEIPMTIQEITDDINNTFKKAKIKKDRVNRIIKHFLKYNFLTRRKLKTKKSYCYKIVDFERFLPQEE